MQWYVPRGNAHKMHFIWAWLVKEFFNSHSEYLDKEELGMINSRATVIYPKTSSAGPSLVVRPLSCTTPGGGLGLSLGRGLCLYHLCHLLMFCPKTSKIRMR